MTPRKTKTRAATQVFEANETDTERLAPAPRRAKSSGKSAARADEPIVLVIGRYDAGAPFAEGKQGTLGEVRPLSEALDVAWDFDAHIVGYAPNLFDGEAVRLNRDAIEHRDSLASPRIAMQLLIADCDDPKAHASGKPASKDWRAKEKRKLERLSKFAPGFVWFETKGGYRVIWRLESAFTVESYDDAAEWKFFYRGSLAWLRRETGIEFDTTCKDWTRLFRLPNVEREHVGAVTAEVHGELGEPWPADFEKRWLETDEGARKQRKRNAATGRAKSEAEDLDDPEPGEPSVVEPLTAKLAKALADAWCADGRQGWVLQLLGWLKGKGWAEGERADLLSRLAENRDDGADRYFEMNERTRVLDGPSSEVREALGAKFDRVDALIGKHPNAPSPAERAAAHTKEHVDKAEKPLILTHDGLCWLRSADGYDPPIKKTDLGVRLKNLGFDVAHSLPSKGLVIDVPATLQLFAHMPMRLERDFTATGYEWRGETKTLVEGYVLPAFVPRYDPAVEAWLKAFSGGALAELYDWIAGCRQDWLNQPAAALGIIGDPNIGKSLIAGCLARLWGEAEPVPLKAIVAQFNGAMTNCPIWFDDECEAIKAGVVSSDAFRQLLQAREHSYEKKYQEKRKLTGCARVILSCNDPSDIRFSNIAGPGAVSAITDRLALFHVARERTPAVLKALAGLRAKGEQDVDVARIVEHLAWVQANVTPQVQRFLGARPEGEATAIRAAYSGVVAEHPEIFELFREWLMAAERGDPHRTGGGAQPLGVTANGGVWALPGDIVKELARTTTGARVVLGDVQKALQPFREGGRQKSTKIGKRVVHPWRLDAEHLRTALGMTEAAQPGR